MNAWLSLPWSVQLLLVALLGAEAGVVANRWAARLRRELLASEGRLTEAVDDPFSLSSWIPFWGWWRSAGVSKSPLATHARRRAGRDSASALPRSWRPLFVEVGAAVAFVALYAWELRGWGLVAPVMNWQMAQAQGGALHWPIVGHLLLITWMLAASLIDFDEKVIPDQITVTGTLLGLIVALLLPAAALPNIHWLANGRGLIEPLHLASPQSWPAGLTGRPNIGSLLLGVGCYALWCFALLPRSWRSRRGWGVAGAILIRGIRRDPFSRVVAGLFLAGVAGIAGAWAVGDASWRSLLSALVGMVVSGGIVWLVRIIGAATLRREAMGFGDVTLMCMIGAFLGWQAGLMVFFVAPFFGLALGLVQAIIARDAEIPYGPFLCLGTLAVIVRWSVLWDSTREIFAVGWLLPATLGVLFVLMTLMLAVWGRFRRRWFESDADSSAG